jgi:hypothetical protein
VPVAGAIAERSRRVIPVTWDALSVDGRYGDGLLQDTVDLVKENLFGSVINPGIEDTYPLRLLDYAGKLVALELITPGIDLWMNMPTSENASDENRTWVDRAEKLRQLRDELLAETRRLAPEMETLIAALTGFRPTRRAVTAPGLSTIDDELLTPSPQEFSRPYARTARS